MASLSPVDIAWTAIGCIVALVSFLWACWWLIECQEPRGRHHYAPAQALTAEDAETIEIFMDMNAQVAALSEPSKDLTPTA